MTKKETFSESARPHMGIPVAGCNCLGCSAVRELHEGVALRGSPLETPAHRKWPGEPPHCPSCSCGAPAETNGEIVRQEK